MQCPELPVVTPLEPRYVAIMIDGRQIRAARALLGWTAKRLAEEARVHYTTISGAEGSDGVPNVRAATLARIQETFEAAGVTFLDGPYAGDGGPGVRLREKP